MRMFPDDAARESYTAKHLKRFAAGAEVGGLTVRTLAALGVPAAKNTEFRTVDGVVYVT